MKKIIFLSLIFATLISFGKCCKKKKHCSKKTSVETTYKLNTNEAWMQYDETKCENPWQFNWFAKPTEEQILGAVKSELLGKEINILEIKSSFEEGLISCEACNCLNGRHFYIRVNKTEIEKLKALNFYEVKGVPEIENINTTK